MNWLVFGSTRWRGNDLETDHRAPVKHQVRFRVPDDSDCSTAKILRDEVQLTKRFHDRSIRGQELPLDSNRPRRYNRFCLPVRAFARRSRPR